MCEPYTKSLVRLKASTEAMDKPGCMRELAESRSSTGMASNHLLVGAAQSIHVAQHDKTCR